MKRSGMIMIIAALLLTCVVGLTSPREAGAVTNTSIMYIDVEGNGPITGTVGQAIEPYRFTLTVKKGPAGNETPSFKYAYEEGCDVTAWFAGTCIPEENVFKRLPLGLTVKTAKAINVGDTTAEFEITGTPYMGSTNWLQIGIKQSVFDGNADHTNVVETSNGIQFSIRRTSNNISLKLSPSALTISGSAGTAISSKELTVNLTNGNFIVGYPKDMDVSEWFRGSDWIMNYDGEYMTAKLPAGMSAKLKNAVKVGDTSCTFVISGKPTYGAKEYIVPVIPQGSIAFAGSDRNEHGYGPQGFGCNNDYIFNISGETNKPGIELESVTVNGVETANITGIVGTALEDNLLTYRLKHCTLKTSYAQGHDITGFFVKWNYPAETYAFDGMGVKVEVVEFDAGKNYFTCKITGTPKKSGNGTLTVKLMEEHTSAGVRMSSISRQERKFGFSTPSESTAAYISTQVFDGKLGFMINTSDTPTEIEMSQGYSTDYCLYGEFTKDQDVSGLVSGLPSGVKAYSAEAATNPKVLRVYFKGVPTAASTFKVYADISGSEYATKASSLNTWTTFSAAKSHVSSYTDTYVTFTISAASEAGFAYSYSLDRNDEGTGAVSALPYEELKVKAGTEPIFLRGNISTKQFIEVTNGTAAIASKSVYTGVETEVWLYIPQINFSKAYNALATVNDIVRLKKADGSECPVTGYTIYTETAIAAGNQTGVSILLDISGIATGATACFEGLQIQIKDGSTWKDITMPTGSEYEIGEVITGSTDVTLSSYNGLTASIDDCSINGLSYQSLMDRLGVEVSISGATFRLQHKGSDVTSWFPNLPSGMSAVVKENAPAGSTTVKIRFGKYDSSTGKIGPVTPTQTSSANILVTVPFSALAESKFNNVDGGIVAAVNTKAKFNILESSEFVSQQKGLITSVEYTGEYRNGQPMGNTTTTEYATVYVPGGLLEGYTKPRLRLTLKSQNDDIFNYNSENLIELYSGALGKLSSSSYAIGSVNMHLFLMDVTANRIARDNFTIVKAELFEDGGDQPPASASFKEIDLLPTYIKYNAVKAETPVDTGDEVELPDDNGNGSENGGGSNNDPDSKPDIWVNGKDNKKDGTYYKSMSKALSELAVTLPDDCKYVVSVTDTTVTEASGAFTQGKGQKNNAAKAAYKKSDDGGAVTVTAGKMAAGKSYEIVRVWIAAIDKKKAVQSSDFFDVIVGVAPKKLYLTKGSTGEKTAAVKSILLNMGDTEKIFVNADGTALSSYAEFTWEAPKDNDGLLLITPSNGTAQSATIGLNSVPTDGKVKKISVNAVNKESGKKISFSVIVSNSIQNFTGLEQTYQLDSAAENAVEQELAYEAVCAGSGATTDKIKVYVTTALEEGTGYTLTKNDTKFTQSGSKSKVKVTYKDGKFNLKAPKKTTDGTKVRVLIVATHADKTIDVFESGVITIGTAATEGNN